MLFDEAWAEFMKFHPVYRCLGRRGPGSDDQHPSNIHRLLVG